MLQTLPTTREYVENVLAGKPIAHTVDGDVEVGVRYLKHLLDAFNGDERLALAGWYQGERAVRAHGPLQRHEAVRRERAGAEVPHVGIRRKDARAGQASDRLPAVDHHRVADDEGGRVRAQPEDGGGDLLGLAHPADRLLRDHPRAALGVPPLKRSIIGGVDDAGADGVDADVRRA